MPQRRPGGCVSETQGYGAPVPALLPDGTLASDDGAWRFTGGRWSRLPGRRHDPPGLFWFWSAPGWFGPALCNGLIALIPIAGAMNLYGWSLTTADNLRAGYPLTAPAGFHYLGRGARYVLWGCIAAAVQLVASVATTVAVAGGVYSGSHDWAWTIAIAAAAWWTVAALLNLILAPLTVPVLHLIDGEGIGAALSPGRLVKALRHNWDVAWYGALALVIWTLVVYSIILVGHAVPLVGPFAGLLATAPGYGALGLLLAGPLARVGEPPGRFKRGQSNLIAGGYAAVTAAGLISVWGIALAGAAIISSHPGETACFFQDGCDFAYSGNLETMTTVSRDAHDPGLVRVETTFINHSPKPAGVDGRNYWLTLGGGGGQTIRPSGECELPPDSATVPPNSRVTQSLCFRVPDGATGC